MPETRILMGVIGRPHGVKGLVRVTSYAADPADLTAYGPLMAEDGQRLSLRWVGPGLASVEGVADRTAAEKLTNLRLFLDRASLPEAEEEEFYHADLVGLAAQDTGGAVLGHVVAVHDYGAGASLEIARDGAAPLLVPFNRASVPVVDVTGGRVVVDPPAEVVAEAPHPAPLPHAEEGEAGPSRSVPSPATRERHRVRVS